MGAVLWVYLVAASVRAGGLITLGALVAAVRRAGGDVPPRFRAPNGAHW